MSKKNDTWMPLYIGDYLADTSRLTTEQHGAYLLILMDYWRNGPPLDDDEELATIAKLSTPQWRKHAPKIRALFSSVDGRLVQKRAEQERERAGLISNKRREAGKQGAAKRWRKDGDKPDGKEIANAMANGMANGMADPSSELWQNDRPSQSQSHNTIPTSSGVGTSHGVGAVDNSAPPPLSADAIGDLLVQLEAEKGRALRLSSRAREALLRIADRCIDVPVLLRAHALACARRAADGDASPVNPGFLGLFIDEAMAAEKGAVAGIEWDATPEGVQAKADQLGVERNPDEHAIVFRLRVIAASGDQRLMEREVSKAQRMNPTEFERVHRIMYGVAPGQVMA